MKTWHWIALAGIVAIGVFIFLRRRGNTSAPIVAGVKVGSGVNDAGAPPLPNVSMANPPTAAYFTFNQMNSFGKRVF